MRSHRRRAIAAIASTSSDASPAAKRSLGFIQNLPRLETGANGARRFCGCGPFRGFGYNLALP
jgi:hypothetical protein